MDLGQRPQSRRVFYAAPHRFLMGTRYLGLPTLGHQYTYYDKTCLTTKT